jgi:hypothetical protein
MERLSLLDLYGGWSLLFVIVFGTIGLFASRNDLVSMAKGIALGSSVAPFAAAVFALPMYLAIHIAP